ncbi:MAG: NAD(+)/NADH kinase [Planctomycetes bacterium]|nr:NAD(+)/NADH kinase [Planctomycetota bacterium]
MILLAGDGSRADVKHGIAQVEPLLRELTDEVLVDLDQSADLEKLHPALVINFGGDGSLLRAVRRLGARQAPVLGVNFGKFGFLAEYELPELLVRLKDAVDMRLPTRQSLMLKVTLRQGRKTSETIVLNDIVLLRAPDDRMPTVHVSAGSRDVASYYGDGLIVSTPLGSTAYNLSAGGPLLHPNLDALVITPICAHTLSIRPLVLPAQDPILLELEQSDAITATMDGQGTIKLQAGDCVSIERSPVPMTLVAHPTRSYFDTLRLKFDWTKRTARSRPK